MRLWFAAVATLLAALPASAQPAPPTGDWRVNIGALGIVGPSYEGSDRLKARALPALDVEWRETVFLSAQRGLGANLLTISDPNGRGTFKAGPLVNWRFMRDADDDSDLRGLGDVKGGVDLGAFAAYEFGRLALNVTGKRNVSHSELGGMIDVGLRYRMRVFEGTMLGFGPSATWADSDYMKSYFGVTAAQAGASGLAAYAPSSGFKDVGVGVNVVHPLGGNWSLVGLGGYSRLIGDAADSPLVKQRGSANQMRVGLGISYRLF
jgi:outer membrane scaffolding protein for murein synthesis (MipA/OmpV family)